LHRLVPAACVQHSRKLEQATLRFLKHRPGGA